MNSAKVAEFARRFWQTIRARLVSIPPQTVDGNEFQVITDIMRKLGFKGPINAGTEIPGTMLDTLTDELVIRTGRPMTYMVDVGGVYRGNFTFSGQSVGSLIRNLQASAPRRTR